MILNLNLLTMFNVHVLIRDLGRSDIGSLIQNLDIPPLLSSCRHVHQFLLVIQIILLLLLITKGGGFDLRLIIFFPTVGFEERMH
jgi:hypothetical protein